MALLTANKGQLIRTPRVFREILLEMTKFYMNQPAAVALLRDLIQARAGQVDYIEVVCDVLKSSGCKQLKEACVGAKLAQSLTRTDVRSTMLEQRLRILTDCDDKNQEARGKLMAAMWQSFW